MTDQYGDRSKPQMNVGNLGDAGHGKSTMTSALLKAAAGQGQARGAPATAFAVRAPSHSSDSPVLYELAGCRFTHFDVPAEGVARLFTSATPLDSVFLVISAIDGPMSQAREHVRRASEASVKQIVVFLNKVDLIEDSELLDLVEMEIRQLLNSAGFPGDTIPIVRGSATLALDGDQGDLGAGAIQKLLAALVPGATLPTSVASEQAAPTPDEQLGMSEPPKSLWQRLMGK